MEHPLVLDNIYIITAIKVCFKVPVYIVNVETITYWNERININRNYSLSCHYRK